MRRWIGALDLPVIILACQDGGSLIGLRLVAEMPERFAGVALSNGGLPEGQPAPRAFAIWRAFSRYSPVFPIDRSAKPGRNGPRALPRTPAMSRPFRRDREKPPLNARHLFAARLAGFPLNKKDEIGRANC